MGRLLVLVVVGWSSTAAFPATLAYGQRADALEGLLSVQPDPASCLAEPALRARVGRWLAPRALVPTPSLRVVVSPDPVAFTVQRDGRDVARRTFDVLPVQCAHRLDAVGLAIAVALEHLAQSEPSAFEQAAAQTAVPPDPTAASRTPDSPTDARSAPTGTPATVVASEAATAKPATPEAGEHGSPASLRADANHYALLAHAALWLEGLPEMAGAFGLGLELGLRATRWSAIGLASTETDSALATGRAEARFFGARAQGCLALELIARDLHAEPCAGVIAGVVRARGDGFPLERSTTLPYVAPLLRIALRYPARSLFSVRLALDGLFNAVRPELQVIGAGAAEDSAAALGLAPSLELLVELP
jgi:hypothetical protein